MKPPAFRLRPEAYPVRLEMPPRFSDLDAQNHINNVVIGDFYQEGRTLLFRHLIDLLGSHPMPRSVVAHGAISYLREGGYPGVVTASSGIGRVGRSSIVIAQALFQDGQCIGTADFTIVFLKEGSSAPMDHDMRAALEKLALTGQDSPSPPTAGAPA